MAFLIDDFEVLLLAAALLAAHFIELIVSLEGRTIASAPLYFGPGPDLNQQQRHIPLKYADMVASQAELAGSRGKPDSHFQHSRSFS